MEIIQQLISKDKYGLKCPYFLEPKFITIHNTGNNASAQNEIDYMKKNMSNTSFHIAVDDKVAILGIQLDRNAWHAGDGSNGVGNRQSIGIEICYSTDYTSDRHEKAFYNAVEVTKQLMKQFNIPIENVKQHYDWTKKNCPHRIRQEGTWKEFLSLCEKESESDKMNFKTVNYQNGSTHLRKVATAIFVYVKKDSVPKLTYKTKTLSNGAVMYGFKIERSEDVIICPSYSESPKFVKDLINDWFSANGFELVFACNGGYFKDGSTSSNYGLPTGGVLNNWSKSWETYKSQQCMPNKGKGYPTMFSDGYKIDCVDEWEFPFFSKRLGSMYWALSLGQSVIVNGEPNDTIGKENGRANNNETKPMVGWGNDGSFICICNVKVGMTLVERQKAINDYFKEFGISRLHDCDGNGSTLLMFNMDIINSKEPIPTPDPEPEHDYDTINVDSVGLRIRESLSFVNGKPTGKVIGFIPVGDNAKLIGFVDGIQKDGYQWVKVEYKGITGYSQYDSMCYWIDDGNEK